MKNVLISFLLAITLCAACYMLGLHNGNISAVSQSDTITVTDTIIKRDTLVKVKPKPYKVETIRTVIDTLYNTDSVKTAVNVPISRYNFKGDTLTTDNDSVSYRAIISGYRVNLDSLSIITKHNQLNTSTIIYKKKRFTHGLQVGIGYGITSKKVEPYIGYGFQINF